MPDSDRAGNTRSGWYSRLSEGERIALITTCGSILVTVLTVLGGLATGLLSYQGPNSDPEQERQPVNTPLATSNLTREVATPGGSPTTVGSDGAASGGTPPGTGPPAAIDTRGASAQEPLRLVAQSYVDLDAGPPWKINTDIGGRPGDDLSYQAWFLKAEARAAITRITDSSGTLDRETCRTATGYLEGLLPRRPDVGDVYCVLTTGGKHALVRVTAVPRANSDDDSVSFAVIRWS